ncbi:MAG: ATP-binding cassette domain-containing protein [Vulcanimicrobiaceae bacterium]
MLDAHIVKRRAQQTVDVALQLEAGAALGLFGASGAGKSTVLSCIAGVEEPDGGFVRVGDVQLFAPSLPLHRRPIGYLTQDANLFPHLSVEDNVRFGLRNGRRAVDEDLPWLHELRDRLALGSVWPEPASRLSGGQARRVALARMLARRPQLVLLDEPFAGLDRPIVRELLAALVEWQHTLRFSMIVVDHQATVLERLCSRVLVLEEGRAVQDGRWDDVRSSPATPLLEALLAPL